MVRAPAGEAVQAMTSSVPPVSDAGSVMARAYMLLESEAELIFTRWTKLTGEWPESASMWKTRHAELIECAAELIECAQELRQLRALAEERRLGPREG